MAKAILKTLEHMPTGYNERGRLMNDFYDLLEAAVVATSGSEGCAGCQKERERAAALEVEKDLLENRLTEMRGAFEGQQA